MIKTNKRILSSMLALVFMLTFVFQVAIVSAEETPTLEISYEKEQYDVDEVFIATVQLSNARFNGIQVAVYFDPQVVTLVKTDGTSVDGLSAGPALALSTVQRTDMFNSGTYSGIFTATGTSADVQNGLLTYGLYVNENQIEVPGGIYQIEGGELFDVLGIRFKAIADGDPNIHFATENSPVYDDSLVEGYGVNDGTGPITCTLVEPTITIGEGSGDVPVTGVELDEDEITLEVGQTQQLTATVQPSDATDKTVTWSSSDDDLATVVDGLVTAIAEGSATITVTTNDGGFTDECVVIVTDTSSPTHLQIGSISGEVDSNVTVPVSIVNAQDVTGYQVNIIYDETKLDFVKVESSITADEGAFVGEAVEPGNIGVALGDDDEISLNGDTEIFTIEFTIKAEENIAVEGAYYDDVEDKLVPNKAIISDADANEIEIDVVAGQVTGTVSGPDYGNADGEGEITVADVTFTLKVALGIVQSDEDIRERADVNGSGKVTVADAVLILRYLAAGGNFTFPVQGD